MKNTINRILALCCGLILIGCNSGGSSSSGSNGSGTPPATPTVSLTSPNPTTSINTPITLTFSEAVSNVNTNTIQFECNGGKPQTITIASAEFKRNIFVTPELPLDSGF